MNNLVQRRRGGARGIWSKWDVHTLSGPLDNDVTYHSFDISDAGRVTITHRSVTRSMAITRACDHRICHSVEPDDGSFTSAQTGPIELHAWAIDESGTHAEVAFSAPVDSHLIGSPGAAPAAVTASAYVSRNQWTASDGNICSTNYPLRTLAPFSSPGPLRKNTPEKPDFALAGEQIVSCRSSQAS